MVKKVLPPLNEQNQIPNIATSGEWKAEHATFLEKLSKGLKMTGEERQRLTRHYMKLRSQAYRDGDRIRISYYDNLLSILNKY